MADISALIQQGMACHKSGKLAEAKTIYERILTLDPQNADSLHLLGLIALDQKSYDTAEQLIRKAIAGHNNVALFHSSLGNVLKAREKFDEAIACYEYALSLKPDSADVFNNMGAALLSLGRMDEALESFKKSVVVNPQHINAIHNIGLILHKQKKYEEAASYYQKAIALKPDIATLHYNLGIALLMLDKTEESMTYLQNALKFNPDYADALFKIGKIFQDSGQYEMAFNYYVRLNVVRPDGYSFANIALVQQYTGQLESAAINYKRAADLLPDNFEFMNNLGMIYNELEQYEDAITYYKKSLELKPGRDSVLGNLAAAYKNLGRLDEAIACLKHALDLSPDQSRIYNNLLMTMMYAASFSPEELANAAREFGRRIADPLMRTKPFTHDKNTERKLRIGYASPDFCRHAVHYFVEPLLKLHDRQKFEIFAYSNTPREDAITERIKAEVDHWRDIRFISEDTAADLIEADKIDILVDLAGHTGHNSLMVFARKPAPVQATWLGYPATTGMKAMDYRITDVHAEPVGMTQHLNTETLWRLPGIFCCYQPHEHSPAQIDHPPLEDNGYITFGCFNNFTKVTDPVLAAWSKIMAQTPGSRLLLEIAGICDQKFYSDVERRIRKAGLPLERVILEARKPSNQYILYNKIDIALDPFPCNGGTTSMDTLWMGVPFVTLAGAHFVSRMGVTILTNAGLPELIAQTPDEYVSIASTLANDWARLKKLRQNLRDKVSSSPLMNQETFARNIEAAYREMWIEWCSREDKKVLTQ